MIQKTLLLAICLGFCGLVGHGIFQKQSGEDFVIGPAEEVSMQTEGQCIPARLLKKPMILPKQKCRVG